MLNLVFILTEPVIEHINESNKRQKINWTSAFPFFIGGVNRVDSILKSIWKSFKINTEAIITRRKFTRDKRKKGSRQ